jgi:hypothetical protein
LLGAVVGVADGAGVGSSGGRSVTASWLRLRWFLPSYSSIDVTPSASVDLNNGMSGKVPMVFMFVTFVMVKTTVVLRGIPVFFFTTTLTMKTSLVLVSTSTSFLKYW